MSLLSALIIGLLIGGGAGYFIKGSPDYLVVNILTGVIGSIIGLVIYFFFLSTAGAAFSLFTWNSALCSAICALLAVLISIGGQRLMPKRAALTTHVEKEDTEIDED